MYRPLLLSLLYLCTLASCERIEVEPQPTTPTPNLPTIDSPNDSEIHSVAEAHQWLGSTQSIYVVGYIVGCIEGTSLGKARFTPPFTNESNLLLADSPTEHSPERCLPIGLPANTNARAELNLKDNPTLHRQRLIVMGAIRPYFRIAGIPSLQAYELHSPTTPTPPTPPSTDSTKEVLYPTLDSTTTDTLISRARPFHKAK